MPSWLVIGSSRGLGLEYIRQLSSNPNNIVFGTARNLEKAAQLVELAKSNPNVHALTADLTSLKSLLQAAEEVSKVTGGSLDVLVNNGALMEQLRLSLPPTYYETHLEEIEKEFMDNYRVNTLGPVFAINAFLPLLRRGQLKKIINISALLGDVEFTLGGVHQAVPYSASKAALNMVTFKYATELKKDGFTIVAMHPGIVRGESISNHQLSPEEAQRIGEMMASIQTLYPKIKNFGVIEADYAVRKQIETINRLSINDTGGWVSYKGDKTWIEQETA